MRLGWVKIVRPWIVPSSDVAAWHQALAYAVLGRRLPELSHQDQPDVAGLARELSADDQLGDCAALRAQGTWPVPVPSDLMVGLGRAHPGGLGRAGAKVGVRRAPGPPGGRSAGQCRRTQVAG